MTNIRLIALIAGVLFEFIAITAILIAVIHGLFGRHIAPRWRHAMWMLVLVRLALPVVPSSPVSLFNLAPPNISFSLGRCCARAVPAQDNISPSSQSAGRVRVFMVQARKARSALFGGPPRP